ncbi:MAG: class I SAM-dependent methyltransferase [Candidatus Heimdallarchaeota archaeon]|nr:class I SAM-dependent methyltransferase [Candidatus Heimdallarchaeota archaeon]MBY8995071.1 class I SAM-dependent methyltransferase [Candidatus Heimdallarchaeota archaeon]
MKEVSMSYPISQIQYQKPQRKKLKERLNFGIMYQHPRIYDFAIWLNDPSCLIPKTIARNVVGDSVLDLGCGTASLQTFLPKDIRYTGVDLNTDFLIFADKKGRGTFYKRDILEDLSDVKSDTVVLSDVLHHVSPNHQKLLENAIKCARKKVIISACYEKEEGPFKQISEFIGRRIIDNDGLNEQREGAGWLKLDELLQFLMNNGATIFQKVLSHIYCEINI